MERVSQESELGALLVFRPEVQPKRLRSSEQFLNLFFARFYFLAVQRHQVGVHGAILPQTRRVCPPSGRARPAVRGDIYTGKCSPLLRRARRTETSGPSLWLAGS